MCFVPPSRLRFLLPRIVRFHACLSSFTRHSSAVVLNFLLLFRFLQLTSLSLDSSTLSEQVPLGSWRTDSFLPPRTYDERTCLLDDGEFA